MLNDLHPPVPLSQTEDNGVRVRPRHGPYSPAVFHLPSARGMEHVAQDRIAGTLTLKRQVSNLSTRTRSDHDRYDTHG